MWVEGRNKLGIYIRLLGEYFWGHVLYLSPKEEAIHYVVLLYDFDCLDVRRKSLRNSLLSLVTIIIHHCDSILLC